MPPKRKRVEDSAVLNDPTASRATRSSTRTKAAPIDPPPVKTTKKATKAAAESKAEVAEEPAPKRKKTATAKAGAADKGAKRGKNQGQDESTIPAVPVSPQKAETITSRPSHQTLTSQTVSQHSLVLSQTPKKAPAAPPKNQPYSPQGALVLFDAYADREDPSFIEPDGFERLLTDAEIAMDGALPLILAWQLNASDMARISRDEWVKGTSTLKISSLDALSIALNELQDLVIDRKPPLKRPAKVDKEPYDRATYQVYANDPASAFRKLYSYCFNLAKPAGSRNIDMDTSTAFWTVLLVPQYPIMQEVVTFIGEKRDTYRATNKDLWSMMLEFCQTVKPTLEDFEADGAWPTLLDDFVLWKKANGLPEMVERIQMG